MNTQSLTTSIINNANAVLNTTNQLTNQHQIPELTSVLAKLDKKTKALANMLSDLNNLLDMMSHLNHSLSQSVTVTREITEIRCDKRPFIDVKYTYKLAERDNADILLIKVGFADSQIEFWFNPRNQGRNLATYCTWEDSHYIGQCVKGIKCSMKTLCTVWWPRISASIKTGQPLQP
jgi:hypothetical protein